MTFLLSVYPHARTEYIYRRAISVHIWECSDERKYDKTSIEVVESTLMNLRLN